MITVPQRELDNRKAIVARMQIKRQPYWSIWRDLADYYLPVRVPWLMSTREWELTKTQMTNPFILNGTGTLAARTLAAGLMNGIASPARPWFKLRLVNFADQTDRAARIWLDEVEKRLQYILAESNFYNSLAVLFLDLCVFSTAAMTIYEDQQSVIHCQNHPLGSFYLGLDNRRRVASFAEEFNYSVQQMVQEFGIDNCSERVQRAYKEGGGRLLDNIHITHLCEPNDYSIVGVPTSFKYRELWWEDSTENIGQLLRLQGYNEQPTVVTRWEANGNDPYGTGPGMEALGDNKQLQHETKKKAQALDKMVSPPILADIMLENKPFALLPNGVTFVPRLDATNGAKPLYQVTPPLGEMSQDIAMIEQRIRDTFYNYLFNKVTSLPTVRSAREIDAIEQEKLVLLGAVLERFENEGLGPALDRVFNIASRRGILPPAPASIRGRVLQVQYVSLIASAQSAAGTAATERFLQFGGQLVAVWPELREVPEIVDLYIGYGADLGVPQKYIRDRASIQAIIAQQSAQQQQVQQTDQAQQLAQAGETLSNTDVGGGQNVLQRMLTGAPPQTENMGTP